MLHFDRAAHRVHHAAELNNGSIAGSLDDATVVHGDCGINQIAADRPKPRQRTIFVRAGEPAVTDYVRRARIAAIFRVSLIGPPCAATLTESLTQSCRKSKGPQGLLDCALDKPHGFRQTRASTPSRQLSFRPRLPGDLCNFECLDS